MRNADSPSRLSFGLRWIAANIVGYALATMLWVTFSQPVWPALSGILSGNLTLALYGAVVGAGASLAQVLVLRQPAARAVRWIVSMAAGVALGFVVASWVALAVTQAFPPGVNKYVNNSIIYLAFGAVAGSCVGLGRWLALRGAVVATRWMLVSAVAFLVGYSEATVLIQLIYPLSAPMTGAVYGAVAGALIALVEWLWLRRQTKAWPVAHAPLEA